MQLKSLVVLAKRLFQISLVLILLFTFDVFGKELNERCWDFNKLSEDFFGLARVKLVDGGKDESLVNTSFFKGPVLTI